MAKTVREALPPRFIRLLQADSGAAAIEYGLVAALIAGALLISLSAIGTSLNAKFSQLGSSIAAAQGNGGDKGNNGNGKGGNGNGNNGNGNGNGGPAG